MKQIFFILIFCLLFLSACTNEQVNSTNNNSASEESSNNSSNEPTNGELIDQNEGIQETIEDDVDYSKFFMPEGSTAYFLGEGNEFATFTVKTKWLSDRYVALVEDNGGAAILKIYRVMDEDDKVEKVYDQVIEEFPNDVTYPTVDELNKMPLIEPYLNGPLEVGTVIGDWKIVQVDTTLSTPYKSFEHVIVLEEISEDFTNRKYFAIGFGEVKRESIMQVEGEDPFVVTSTLEKIETKP
ncbi:MAG TPA: hypothetical protein VNR38_09980 [Ureibacillus sp.]|nr:hypothetical protein [Ureibacillus sp.]